MIASLRLRSSASDSELNGLLTVAYDTTNSSKYKLVCEPQIGDNSEYEARNFIRTYSRAIRNYFSCPICNDLFRKPKILPGCGHLFCSSCLSYWFLQNPAKSCPVCRKFLRPNQSTSRMYTLDAFLYRYLKLSKLSTSKKRAHSARRLSTLLIRSLELQVNAQHVKLVETHLTRLSEKDAMASPSLNFAYRRWTFQQLLSTLTGNPLRMKESQKRRVSHCGYKSRLDRIYQHFQEGMLRAVTTSHYPLFFKMFWLVKVFLSGRTCVSFRRLNSNESAWLIVALILMMTLYMLLSFIIERGLKGYLKILVHFVVIFTVNEFFSPAAQQLNVRKSMRLPLDWLMIQESCDEGKLPMDYLRHSSIAY